MANFNYSLSFEDYTWENAFLWGNFKGHCKKANEGTFGHRIIHVLIAAAEFLPIIGQIASIFEMIIIKNFGKLTESPRIDPILPNRNIDKGKSDQSNGENLISTSRMPCGPLPIYLEKYKEVIVNSENANECLDSFGHYINTLFQENYDEKSSLKLFNMFEFSARNKESWQILVHLNHQYRPCFQNTEIVLNIVKDFLTIRFTEKILDIQINDEKIDITWKS
jgi:hypothetical protein